MNFKVMLTFNCIKFVPNSVNINQLVSKSQYADTTYFKPRNTGS